MKVSEIVKMCGEILNLNLSDEYFDSSVAPDEFSVKVLINACNFVLEELYRDYATSIRKTVVEVKDGFADTSIYKLCKVISLLDEEGNDVKFRYGDGGIFVDSDGKYNLCYARLPSVMGWNDEVALPSPRLTERILIYGVVREYLSIVGDWQTAKQWETRFKDALQVACCKTSTMRMPVGRWM